MAATSNSDLNSQDKGPTILALQWTLTVLATIFVAARIFVRTTLVKRMGLDDYLIILSLAFGYLFVGLTTASVKAGNGKHAAALTTSQLEDAIMLNTAGFAPGLFGFITPKLAVVALLTRIMNPSRKHRIWLWSMTIGGGLIILVCVAILYAQCDPPKAMWIVTIKNSKCWSPWILVDYAIFAGALSAAMDLYLAIYPAVVLWKLQLNMKKKIGLSIALGLGSCASVVAIYKCTRLPGLADKEDFTYSTADLVIWTSIEGNSIVIAACIPTLAPLIELILGKKALGSSSGPTYYNRYGKRSGHMRTSSVELDSRKDRVTTRVTTKQADESQESILPADALKGQGSLSPSNQIQQTINVTVEYENNHEMQGTAHEF